MIPLLIQETEDCYFHSKFVEKRKDDNERKKKQIRFFFEKKKTIKVQGLFIFISSFSSSIYILFIRIHLNIF